MILKCHLIAGVDKHVKHVTNENDNDHIDNIKVEGFITTDPRETTAELLAFARPTQCKKPIASFIMSPPENATFENEDYLPVSERIMDRLGLTGQPHFVVVHEKEGRKHAHLIVSRIDMDNAKAIHLDFYKKNLNALSRDLFMEHGWDLPKGFTLDYQPNPNNYTFAEHQQGKRLGAPIAHIKPAIRQAWERSDSKSAFEAALSEKGCFLARGDRRGFVAVSWEGTIIPLNNKNLQAKAKEVRAKLGQPEDAPSIKAVKAKIALEHHTLHKRLRRELALQHKLERQPLTQKKRTMVKAQRQERSELRDFHQQRTNTESQQRLKRLRKGWRGLWDLVTGQSHKTKQHNKLEAEACHARDTQEKHAMQQRHIHDRQALQKELAILRDKHAQETIKLNARFIQHSQGHALKGQLQQDFTIHHNEGLNHEM